MGDKEQKVIFSRNLNRLLSDEGKTQKEVAEAIHVLPSTFNTWCQGVALPRMGKVQLLADYFGINKSDLIEAPATRDASPANQAATRDALSEHEREHIRKYRALDDDGRQMVDTVLDTAFWQATRENTAQGATRESA